MQIFHTSFSANILFLNTWNSKSHALTMKPFLSITAEVQTEDQGSVGIVFWYMEMTPEALARTHLIGFEYLKHSMQDVISTPYDLVILDEMFASAQGAMALAIQKKFNSKLALFATTDLISQASMGRGFCRNPVISPRFQASFGTFTDFPSRFGFSSPQSRDLIDIAEHCQEPNELPSDFLAIVIATLSAFVSVYFKDNVDSVKPHVKILPWAPQRDILAHKNTILFFTHGGLKSVKEGICSNTAMLFLPFFADQPRNSLLARDMGFAEVIYKKVRSMHEKFYTTGTIPRVNLRIWLF
uniref:glucuronosyltransferase n=1 Tax=Angiostrongylus cantonensis TaxID=6313 RepID=A0A158P6E0_ANGCA